MKTIKIKLFICLGLLSLCLWSCNEDTVPIDENCIEARLVEDICGQAVIQVISPHAQFMELGSYTHWEKGTFENVFGTFLDCEDMENIPRDGSSFRIRIIEEPRPQTCGVCLALLANMPKEQYHMRIVQDCNAEVAF